MAGNICAGTDVVKDIVTYSVQMGQGWFWIAWFHTEGICPLFFLTDIRQRHYIQISVWSKPDILRIMLPVCSDSWLCWQRHRHPFGSYIGIRHLLLLHWSIFEMANRWELQKKCQDLNVILKRLNKSNGLNRWYCTSRLLLCPCTRFIYS